MRQPPTGAQSSRVNHPGPLELEFVESIHELVPRLRDLTAAVRGHCTIRVTPAAAAAKLQAAFGGNVRIVTALEDSTEPPADIVAVASDNPEVVSDALLTCLDVARATVVAPVTEHHFSRRPLFLNSIPKGGSSMLAGLANALGYQYGHSWREHPAAQHWYYLRQDPHVPANILVNRTLHDIADHPFFRSPALLIYRDPRDILVSEANWFHRPQFLPYSSYFIGLSFRERLSRLLNDPWLWGSIRDRVAAYAAWLDYPNVVPISYEELVGPEGGGDAEEQRRVIWSLQLKLHVPGRPENFAAKVYNRASHTFHEGRIGAWREAFDPEIRQQFAGLPQDFMQRFGYDSDGESGPLPAHRHHFRRRRLLLSKVSFSDVPALFEADVAGCNIVRYRERYFAVAHGASADITALSDEQLALLPSDNDVQTLRLRLVLPSLLPAAGADQSGPLRLLESHDGFNLVHYRGRVVAAHRSVGPIDWDGEPDALVSRFGSDRIIVADTLEAAHCRIDLLRLERRLAAIEARLAGGAPLPTPGAAAEPVASD